MLLLYLKKIIFNKGYNVLHLARNDTNELNIFECEAIVGKIG